MLLQSTYVNVGKGIQSQGVQYNIIEPDERV